MHVKVLDYCLIHSKYTLLLIAQYANHYVSVLYIMITNIFVFTSNVLMQLVTYVCVYRYRYLKRKLYH